MFNRMTVKPIDNIRDGSRVRYSAQMARYHEQWGGAPHGPGATAKRGTVQGTPHWWDGQQWARVRWCDGVVTQSKLDELEVCDGI